jgi:hypothetical protein
MSSSALLVLETSGDGNGTVLALPNHRVRSVGDGVPGGDDCSIGKVFALLVWNFETQPRSEVGDEVDESVGDGGGGVGVVEGRVKMPNFSYAWWMWCCGRF